MPGSIFSRIRRRSDASSQVSPVRSSISRAVPDGGILIDPAPKMLGGQGYIEILPEKVVIVFDIIKLPGNTCSKITRIGHPEHQKFGMTVKASQVLVPLIKLTGLQIREAMLVIRRDEGVWFHICTNIFEDDWLITSDQVLPHGLTRNMGGYTFELFDHTHFNVPPIPIRVPRYEL